MSEPSLATTPFQLSDAKQFFELTKDSEIKREYPNMNFDNLEEAEEYLKHQIEITQDSSVSFFKAIRIVFNGLENNYDEANNILIGFISVHKSGLSDQLFSGGFEQTLAYGIKSKFRGKGLMTLALSMTLEAMRQDGYNLIAALVKKENKPSIRVLEKNGFSLVNNFPLNHLFVKRITMNEIEFNNIFHL
jgi:RimJ/RimL family protein N-acetyltransferase